MKLAVIGVGAAGSRLAAQFAASEPDARPYVVTTVAFDTDPNHLANIDIPQANRYAFGTTVGSAEEATAVRIAAEENVQELRHAATDAVIAEADGVLVAVGVGGATGAGAAPVIIDTLRDTVDVPTYTVTVLPTLPETKDNQVAANARAGLRGLEATADSQLVFDNADLSAPDERPSGEDAANAYADANETITEWVAALFSAGEAVDATAIGESVVDASEIVATLGEGGYTTLGYWRQQVTEPPSFLNRLRSKTETPDEIESYSTIETAVQRSLFRQRSAGADLSRATRALLVTMGPPEWLNREAIADARRVLDESIEGGAVRSGDTPIEDGTDLTVLAVCSGMDRPPRVASLIDESA